MSRAKPAGEVRQELLEGMRDIARYWGSQPNLTPAERCDGVVFSILVMFDGESMLLPAMTIALAPHPNDKSYHQEQGRDYYEPGMTINDGSSLHDEYVAGSRKKG